MKKFIITTIFCYCNLVIFGQTIVENKVDEFTKSIKIRTSWEVWNRGDMNYNYVRVSKIDDWYFLDWRIICGVNSISEGGKFMMILSNDSVITLKNDKHVLSCLGCGSTGIIGANYHGINTTISLDLEMIKILKKFLLKK